MEPLRGSRCILNDYFQLLLKSLRDLVKMRLFAFINPGGIPLIIELEIVCLKFELRRSFISFVILSGAKNLLLLVGHY